MTNLLIHGQHDEQTIVQMQTCMSYGSAVRGVLCADGHLGYAQPVGGVIAYENHISVSGVGFDIGCGNTAARTNIRYSELVGRLGKIREEIAQTISFGIGQKNAEAPEFTLMDRMALWKDGDVVEFRELAASQLGTVGGGNHYVDLFRDENDFIWVGVHFGSRGFGHKTATKYLKLAGGKDGINVPPAILEYGSELAERYLVAMTMAGQYAEEGRAWVVKRVLKILGDETYATWINNHHNYAWTETHVGFDNPLFVVRKGATPAFPGQKGFVGGSMGDNAVIIEGVNSPEAAESLYSTVHGAGRVFGRKAAKKVFTRDQMEEWLKRKEVWLNGGDVDESPMAYRRLDDVLEHHKATIRVLHTLKPFMVFMAGQRDFDPYKD